MPEGRVKNFDEDRNYGFIQPLDGSRDVFVHGSTVEADEPLRAGDVVSFELEDGDDGPEASDVTVVERAPEDNPTGRVVHVGAPPPTWDELEEQQRQRRQSHKQRRRRR
ncbi:MAG: cold shock domain-containing protein [Actinobacteria bacterium]|nr:cold shock domain-containing protein [Actinomycetota bacterium]